MYMLFHDCSDFSGHFFHGFSAKFADFLLLFEKIEIWQHLRAHTTNCQLKIILHHGIDDRGMKKENLDEVDI